MKNICFAAQVVVVATGPTTTVKAWLRHECKKLQDRNARIASGDDKMEGTEIDMIVQINIDCTSLLPLRIGSTKTINEDHIEHILGWNVKYPNFSAGHLAQMLVYHIGEKAELIVKDLPIAVFSTRPILRDTRYVFNMARASGDVIFKKTRARACVGCVYKFLAQETDGSENLAMIIFGDETTFSLWEVPKLVWAK